MVILDKNVRLIIMTKKLKKKIPKIKMFDNKVAELNYKVLSSGTIL